jgi:hypothetical protein
LSKLEKGRLEAIAAACHSQVPVEALYFEKLC